MSSSLQLPLHLAQPLCPDGEESIVRALAGGDPIAIGLAYDRYAERGRRLARHLLGNESLAEDAVQDAFSELPKASRSYRGESSFETFVMAVVLNRARTLHRSAARMRARDSRALSERELTASTTPEREVSQRQLAAALYEAMDSLPEDQRLAFVLCELEEHTSVEAAEILGAKEATIRTRLFHARRTLRSNLEKRGIR